MTGYVFIPGAGGAGGYWSQVVARLRAAGHDAVAVDLPADNPTAGLYEYAEIVAARMRAGDVLVAQSMGGFTAPLVCEQVRPGALALVNAMVPARGETPGEWWGDVGSESARVAAAEAGGYSVEFDVDTYFRQDVPDDVWNDLGPGRDEHDIAFATRCDFAAWPDVPTVVIAGADDRFFPVELQRRVARERLGRDVEVLPGGHLIAMSHPDELTARLLDLG